MRPLLGRSHWAIGDNLSTIELEAKSRMEAIHRQTRPWYAEMAGWAPESTEGWGCPEKRETQEAQAGLSLR